VVIGFKRRESSLTAAVKATSIRLNCIPVLNLFSHHSLRTSFDGEVVFNPYEFHVVAEKNAVEDYEVVCVKKIDFYNGHNEHVVRAVNFYDGVGYSGEKANIFFSIKRRRRLFGSSRSKYEGTEVFVSFSPVPPGGVNQFSGDFLLTNRDLPGILRKQSGILKGDIPLTISGLASSRAFFLTLPTEPGYPLSEQGGEKDFSRLSHIVMNLSSMLCQEGEGALMFLRNMLMSYSSLRLAEDTERLALGIKEFSGKRGAFRFIQEGAIFYEWGWRFRLVLDEKAYGGIGFYQFAHVVGQMLLSLTPLNTILELELSTLQSGVITQWSTLENR
jgi:type VI secretion system protein ImpG